ncbi:MAG TPA: hypothetical protein VJ870_13210 [Amycolatopsis sp.]|nr:hypothetical protein [Amycolatopsis sp.]
MSGRPPSGSAAAPDIASVPTVIIFADGVEQRRRFGVKTARQLRSAIAKVASGDG